VRRRLFGLLVVAAGAVAVAALTAGAASKVTTHECRGLQVCVKVAGPWVVVPSGLGVPRRPVEFQLSCPKGYIAGGLDAELSDRAIDVWFLGKVGAPVNPGVTTGRAVVFTATYVGSGARTPSFRPHLGCMPGSGGGRIQTAVTYPLGAPTVRHVKTVHVSSPAQRVTVGCGKRERLIEASHALAFAGSKPPDAPTVASLSGAQSVQGRRVTALARLQPASAQAATGAVVQVTAVCTGLK
jgi:hypothetical protein